MKYSRRNRKDLLPSLIGLGLVTGFSILTLSAFVWSDFAGYQVLDRIQFTGLNQIPEDEFQTVLSPLIGVEMAEFHLREVQLLMENHPYIRAARVSRHYPGTMQIDLVERIPMAMVNKNPLVLFDDQAVVLPYRETMHTGHMPILSNFNTAQELYPPGRRALSEKVVETVVLLRKIRDNYPTLFENLSEITLDEKDEYILVLMNYPTRVRLGPDRIWERIAILKEFERSLEGLRHLTDYTVLDVRYRNQVIAQERS